MANISKTDCFRLISNRCTLQKYGRIGFQTSFGGICENRIGVLVHQFWKLPVNKGFVVWPYRRPPIHVETFTCFNSHAVIASR